jgi:hypothetical protein
MLRHTVYFWLNDDIVEQDRKEFEEGLKKLMNEVDMVDKWEIGIPAPTERRTVTDHSFNYSLLAWFRSLEDHDQYLVHPEHRTFVDRFRSLWKKVKVYDSTVIR